MNTKNNRRRQRSKELIKKAFIELILKKEIGDITVSEICKITGLNRSTFYANYEDIYALADAIKTDLEQEVEELFAGEVASQFNSHDYLKLLRHIYDNRLFYKTYFKLGFDRANALNRYDIPLAEKLFPNENIEYHIAFFKAGFNAIIKKWLDGDCAETPEEISQILKSEYRGRVVT